MFACTGKGGERGCVVMVTMYFNVFTTVLFVMEIKSRFELEFFFLNDRMKTEGRLGSIQVDVAN